MILEKGMPVLPWKENASSMFNLFNDQVFTKFYHWRNFKSPERKNCGLIFKGFWAFAFLFDNSSVMKIEIFQTNFDLCVGSVIYDVTDEV